MACDAKIIRAIGPCRLKRQKGGFAHFAQAILNQQLSKAAADSIMKRLVALAGNKRLTAGSLQALSDKALKSTGVSARKIAYLRDLAEKVLSGQIDFRRLPHLSDEEVIRELTHIKGIGRWSAEMYLIFVLCRPDVLPLDDTALCAAIANLYRLKEGCDRATIAAIGDAWHPHRTAVSWYLWAWRNRISARHDDAQPDDGMKDGS
jgi:DNA-3-methyladenine glycosylase II